MAAFAAATALAGRSAVIARPTEAACRRGDFVRAAANNSGTAAPRSSRSRKAPKKEQNINVIEPISQWPTGIPPAMGGHHMASGDVAPIATSKGPGIDIDPLYFTYPDSSSPVEVTVFEDETEAAQGLAGMIEQANTRGLLTLALSGGSLIRTFAKAVDALINKTDFSKWWLIYVDERNVPHGSLDSNHGATSAQAFNKAPFVPEQVLAIKEGLSVDQAAKHYEGQLLGLKYDVLPRNAAGLPVLDLVLLGVGPDGHIASLFPNSKELAATDSWVLPVHSSPKPPPERITLSLPVINAARHVVIVALGQGKAEVVQRALEVQSLPGALPVQLVRPTDGKLTWVLDKASAADLHTEQWVPEGGKKTDWRFPRSEPPK